MGKRKNRTFKLKKKILMKGGGGFVERLRNNIIGIEFKNVKKEDTDPEKDKKKRGFVKMLDDAIALARQEHDKAQPPPPASFKDVDNPPPVPEVVKSPTDSGSEDSIYIFETTRKKEESKQKFEDKFKELFPRDIDHYRQEAIDDEINKILTGESGEKVDGEQLKAEKKQLLELYEVDPDERKREDAIAGYLLKVMVNIEHLQGQKRPTEDEYHLIIGKDDIELQIKRATAYLYFVREFYKNDPTNEDWKLDQLLVNLGYDPENDDKIDELFDTIFGKNIFDEQLGKELQKPHSVITNNPFVRLMSPKEKIGDEMQTRIQTLQKLWWLCRSIDVLLETDSDIFNIRNVPYGKTIHGSVKSADSWTDYSSGYAETIASKTECGESKMKSVFKQEQSSCDYAGFHGSLNTKVKELYKAKPNRIEKGVNIGVKVHDIIAILESDDFKQQFKNIKRYDLLLFFLGEEEKKNKYVNYYPKRRFDYIKYISFMSDQKYMELLAQEEEVGTGGKRKRQRKTKRRKTQRRKKNITKRRKKRSYRRK